ncbi:MAG: ribbon-helix-helix domain-containing protein [Kiloniellaceae bacterium]
MCQIFAGQDPATYAHIARSVRLDGHATSIRLEAAFWDILDEIARRQDMTTPRFLSTLYGEVQELHGGISNFTSLLRVACVLYLRRPDMMAGLSEAPLEPAAV